MATAVLPADTIVRSEQPAITPPRKLNLFRRFRNKNKKKEKDQDVTLDAQEESEVDVDSPKEATVEATTTAVQQPPPASQAAYGGPPRYDWIDIETAAAVKVQSIARRNLTMADLADQGVSTAAMRNRDRRRRAQRSGAATAGSADVPNLFACCGIGLAFGDATEEEYETTRVHQREEYYQRKQEKEQREADLRNTFNKTAAQKKAARTSDVQEAYEIVE